MMVDLQERSLIVAGSVGDALAARLDGAVVLAGGTWLMRDPRRGQALPQVLVSLQGIAALAAITIETDRIVVGASVTHDALARALTGVAGLEAVRAAAASSANPAIRRVATVGGNLCTQDFAAADLLPALLAVGATVELLTANGAKPLPMASFLAERAQWLDDAILLAVILPRDIIASAHARLPLRQAGDYPVAIVSLALGADRKLRVAVGSVETVARRWLTLEHALAAEAGGRVSGPDRAARLSTACNDFEGRDGTEADGWYRRQVLPALVRRGLEDLMRQETAL